jgi:hypothetical protein
MKCLLHSVPAGRWLAFLLPIFTGVTTTLSAQNERDTSLFVDKSDSLTIRIVALPPNLIFLMCTKIRALFPAIST